MPDHDKNEESNNIKYEDANNLYGCSSSEFLPHGEQYFVNEEFVNKFDFVQDIKKIFIIKIHAI